MASARIQRWALTLGAYSYSIAYKPGEEHANADGLSRLPLPEEPATVPLPGETVQLLDALQNAPVTAKQIQQWTDTDPLLARVRRMVLKGWQYTNEEELQPFHRRRNELSVQDGCILWGSCVVVPAAGRREVLTILHSGHPGMSRMKSIARGIVWWPGLDAELEEKVKACSQCQVNSKSPPQAPLHPWEWPSRPWARVHIDHAGPFQGKLFLVLVDAYSKWLEVVPVAATSSRCTIDALRLMFATHGLPEILVSDNGSGFTSVEFRDFLKANGIRHITSAPYHPATNGLAERAVQTFKTAMKKHSSTDLQQRLACFLFHYCTTPHSTTGVPPAELLMGRHLRTHLDLLHPNTSSRVQASQLRQKSGHDQIHGKLRTFVMNDTVYAKNFSTGPKWLPGVITAVKGPLSYEVTLDDGHVIRRHVDHLKSRSPATTPDRTTSAGLPDDWLPDTSPLESTAPSSSSEPTPSTGGVRRSGRVSVPPERYTPSFS